MNFIKLYMGDYFRDTGSLSLSEHGAYLLMIQHYCATEQPLPQGKELYRLLRAESKSEKEAINSVVKKFWVVTSDGLINARASQEIDKSKAIASKNRDIAVAREIAKRATNGARSVQRMEHEACSDREPNHSQIPEYYVDNLSNTEITQEGEISASSLLSVEFRRCGILGSHPSNATVVELAELGVKPESIAAAVESARVTLGSRKQITLGYVAKILKNWATAPPKNSDFSSVKLGLSQHEAIENGQRHGYHRSNSAVDQSKIATEKFLAKLERERNSSA